MKRISTLPKEIFPKQGRMRFQVHYYALMSYYDKPPSGDFYAEEIADAMPHLNISSVRQVLYGMRKDGLICWWGEKRKLCPSHAYHITGAVQAVLQEAELVEDFGQIASPLGEKNLNIIRQVLQIRKNWEQGGEK